MTDQQLTPEQDAAAGQGGFDALKDYPKMLEDEPGVRAKGEECGYDGGELDAYIGAYLGTVGLSRVDPGMVDLVHRFFVGMNNEQAAIRMLQAASRRRQRKEN